MEQQQQDSSSSSSDVPKSIFEQISGQLAAVDPAELRLSGRSWKVSEDYVYNFVPPKKMFKIPVEEFDSCVSRIRRANCSLPPAFLIFCVGACILFCSLVVF